MQIIDKPTIYSAFWKAYPTGYLLSKRAEEKISSGIQLDDQATSQAFFDGDFKICTEVVGLRNC
jgi:hypothetical protein